MGHLDRLPVVSFEQGPKVVGRGSGFWSHFDSLPVFSCEQGPRVEGRGFGVTSIVCQYFHVSKDRGSRAEDRDSKGSFANDEAILKLLYLRVLERKNTKWKGKGKVFNWPAVMNQY